MQIRSAILAVMFLSLICAAALTGCSDPKAKAAGTYDVDKVALKATAEAQIKAKGENSQEAFTAGMVAGMIDQMNISLTLNADGTATMNSSMMGQTQTATGTWTLDGSAISITAASPGEASETISGTISGDVITLKPPQDQQMPFDLVFKKKSG